ncbi:MAG: prolyl oligopeptidase family serine peptidase [Asticcacaulis sp.]
MAEPILSQSDDPSAPDELIVLSEGASNTLSGVWPDRRFYEVGRLELHIYRPRIPARARALVYPGGGYLDLVHDKEGIEVAQWLNGLGIEAAIVAHRLPGSIDAQTGLPRPYDIALSDSLCCLNLVETWSALPLLHIGLSSGGHLAGVMACQPHVTPSVGVLIGYAPVNANHRHYKAPAGKPDYPPVEKQAFYDAWPIGMTGEAHGIVPVPAFLVYALHDQPVPVDHALNFIRAAHGAGRDVEAHIFPQAPHGFALRDLNGTHDQWPNLAARWIERVLTDQG